MQSSLLWFKTYERILIVVRLVSCLLDREFCVYSRWTFAIRTSVSAWISYITIYKSKAKSSINETSRNNFVRIDALFIYLFLYYLVRITNIKKKRRTLINIYTLDDYIIYFRISISLILIIFIIFIHILYYLFSYIL